MHAALCLSLKIQKYGQGDFPSSANLPSSAERHSGNFRFTVSPEKKTLLITGPLGASVAKIEENSTVSTMETRDGIRRARSTSELLNQAVGVPVNFEELQSWLEGSSKASAAAQGWEVEISQSSERRCSKNYRQRKSTRFRHEYHDYASA